MDNIIQLLKSDNSDNQILAIQLMIGLGMNIDEIVDICYKNLNNVVFTNGGTELILCDYGVRYFGWAKAYNIRYNVYR